MSQLIEQVTVPEGTNGEWTVAKFEVTERDAVIGNIRAMMHGRGAIQPGTFTQLHHARRGIIMSDTPDEMRDHFEIVLKAKDHVLLNGLGLGMVLGAVLRRPAVTKVTVIESEQSVIALVGPHYLKDRRLNIIQEDAFQYQPPKGVRYGAIWHDIWDDLCGDNLPEMTKLKRKYGRRCDWQGCWGEHYIRRHAA